MNTKLLTSILLAASLLGAPAVAFAQSETTTPAPSTHEAAQPKAMHHTMKSTRTHFRAGTTTGLDTRGASRARPGGQSVARKPAG
jgi:hypothetical protein